MRKKTTLLFFVIIVEGYVVLAAELLAIRQLLPFTGSGVEVVAIVIGGVLMSLAFGYHRGGVIWRRRFVRAKARNKRLPIVRKMLLRNLLIAFFILSVGLSYLPMEAFFRVFTDHNIYNRLLQTAVYTAVFLVAPVYLLGQTVPLVSHYFSRRRLSEITGKMLFFSTVGSFLGSILSALVLMMTIGVHKTVIVTMGLLALLCLLLVHRSNRILIMPVLAIFIGVGFLNYDPYLRSLGIVEDNAYNLVQVIPTGEEGGAVLSLNRSPGALLTAIPENRADYVKYIEDYFITPIIVTGKPHDILMVGAGGFTIGKDDTFDNFTFVDIDPDLRNTAEKEYLHKNLTPNKTFVPSSAQAFFRQSKDQYDLIILDVFQNTYAIPLEVTTREFMQDVKTHLREGGILVANVFASPDFRDKFTARYDRTFGQVFPVHTRQVLAPFNPWRGPDSGDPMSYLANILYIYYNRPVVRDNTVYSDDKDTYSIDRP